MSDILLEKNSNIRFWVCVAKEKRFFHPFPTCSMSQEESIRQKKGCGIGPRKITQLDGSLFRVYGERKNAYAHNVGMPFALRVQKLLYPESVFWNQRYLGLEELLEFLKARSGVRLSYLLYIVNEFIDCRRVLPLLVDWDRQNFIDLSFSFSQMRSVDGFGIKVGLGAGDLNELGILGVKGFTVINYLASKRMCSFCGRWMDHTKPKKAIKLFYNPNMFLN